ncbi:hypothetical protein ElyMa_002936100, partial [Elysia marginata]
MESKEKATRKNKGVSEYYEHNILIDEVRLVGETSLVVKNFYVGMVNSIAEEIQVLFHRYHLYELDYNDYEMVATTGEETVLLDRRMYVEDYMDLLENTTLLTVRPI